MPNPANTNPQNPQSYNYPPSTYTGPSQSNSQVTYAYPPPPDPTLPPGKADLQTLETLKAIIKRNQHQYFRPIPNPQALLNAYEGPLPPEFVQSITQDQSTAPTSPDRRSSHNQWPDNRPRGPVSTNPSPTSNVCPPLHSNLPRNASDIHIPSHHSPKGTHVILPAPRVPLMNPLLQKPKVNQQLNLPSLLQTSRVNHPIVIPWPLAVPV